MALLEDFSCHGSLRFIKWLYHRLKVLMLTAVRYGGGVESTDHNWTLLLSYLFLNIESRRMSKCSGENGVKSDTRDCWSS